MASFIRVYYTILYDFSGKRIEMIQTREEGICVLQLRLKRLTFNGLEIAQISKTKCVCETQISPVATSSALPIFSIKDTVKVIDLCVI